ncbi:MAG: sugar ABC transporter substrate-binding protein [Candidatus Humimicrobiaceae bacterium]
MKKQVILVVLTVFLVSISLVAVGCVQSEPKASELETTAAIVETTTATASGDAMQVNPQKGEGLVYFLAYDMINGFNIGTASYMEKFAKELGYDFKILNPNDSPDEQLNQFETAISLKPKAIIIKPIGVNIVPSVEKAKSEGIVVISYDGTISGTPVDLQSVTGTVKIGQIGAQECIDALKAKNGSEKGTILHLMGDLIDSYAVEIAQGFDEVMKDYPDIEVISKETKGWDSTTSANIVADQLVVSKNIDAIFVHADSRIPAIVPVLEQKGYKPGDIILIGTDGDPSALDLIRNGWIYKSIGVPMVSQVYGCYAFLDKLLAGEELSPGTYDIKGSISELEIRDVGPFLVLPGTIIDKDNVDDPSFWGNIPLE